MWGCGAREPAALPEHCTVWSGGEKKGTRTSAPKTSGEDGGGEEFSAWGIGGNPENICAEENVGQVKREGEEG